MQKTILGERGKQGNPGVSIIVHRLDAPGRVWAVARNGIECGENRGTRSLPLRHVADTGPLKAGHWVGD
ncbi:hypothetical protein [Desulfosarcina sp.]|uniref:hypothetical protein n=1 Tax=Desulfosarcina sp. TaxID=2027861 RepID=UPI003567678C